MLKNVTQDGVWLVGNEEYKYAAGTTVDSDDVPAEIFKTLCACGVLADVEAVKPASAVQIETPEDKQATKETADVKHKGGK